eukprot:scaffold109781_cov92-Cyclotella_meneghiniana.AAC.2
MGARRNDDADLQLRDDNLLFPSDNNIPDAMATHQVPPSPAVVKSNGNSGNTSTYFPFGFIYYSSKNETKKDERENRGAESMANGESALGPPRGAFPPPISENAEDVRREVNEINEYVASHPWYQHPTLMSDTGGDSDGFGGPDVTNSNTRDRQQRRKIFGDYKSNPKWQDQKAILSTTFNFTNAIIGAGAMGLGGAFAASGGGISILCLLGFAYLTKLSLDLIVDLSSCPDIINIVQEYYDNEVRYESEYEEEEVDFDEENNVSSEEREDENNSSLHTPEQDNDQSKSGLDLPIDESNTNAEEETAQIANKQETSPLMAQEQAIHENYCGTDPLNTNGVEAINRYNSLNNDSTPILKMPLLGNPMSNNLQSTSFAQSMDVIPQPCTYEELGRAAYGPQGRLAVLISKCLYSFGCLVAYVVVVRDNFGPALRRIVCSDDNAPAWLEDDDILAFWVSAIIMLPLSYPRTMDPLAKFSLVSVLSIMFLALSVVYLFFSCTDPAASHSTFYENWIEIRSLSGFLESLGTFVFTFVCHHVVNIAYESLPPKHRNPKSWRTVSTNSIVISTEASLAIGLFAYMTFGANTPADVLLAYPPDINLANVCRLLLCLTMVLTFPLPFLTCREMMILIMVDFHRLYYIHGLTRFNIFNQLLGCFTVTRRKLWTLLFKHNDQSNNPAQMEGGLVGEEENFMEMQPPVPVHKRFTNWGKKLWVFNKDHNDEWWNPGQPLLSDNEEENILLNTSICGPNGEAVNPSPLSSPDPSMSSSEESYSDETVLPVRIPAPCWLRKDGNGRQLSFWWHASITFSLWLLSTIFAIKAPSLGDVLNLVGAFTGTLLAFILPALFSFTLKGYNKTSLAIVSIGGLVGVCGTLSAIIKFIADTHR